jgi:DNA-binding SARP family transcriptional activator
MEGVAGTRQSMARLTLAVLGGFEARVEGIGPCPLSVRKVQALLAYLALPAGQAHSRDKLAALLWGEVPESQARTSLRQALFTLRHGLGDAAGALRGDGASVSLDPATVEVDAQAFEREAAVATPEALARAAALYRGDFLTGLAVQEPLFEEWLVSERERLRELALEVLARLLAYQRQTGSVEAAARTALHLLGLDPLQEAVHRKLMRLYVQLGRREAALQHYQRCVEVLGRELGVEPEAETKALYQEILRLRQTHLAVMPTGTTDRVPDAPLVGRAPELSRIHDTLAAAWAGHGRILAIVGEAGIGKSRLLEELAAEGGRRGGAVVLGRAYESEQLLPFGPWVDALRDAGILADPPALEGLGAGRLSEFSRLFPELTEASRAAPVDQTDQLRLFEALAELLRRLALARPLVVLLEDCHWADDMTPRFLAYLARRLHSAPILLVVSVRDYRARQEFPHLGPDRERAFRNVGKLYAAGVRFGFGTDTGVGNRVPGFYEHRELELLVAAGVSPVDALRMATIGSAEIIGQTGVLGEIAPGRRADLVVLKANPLQDIRNTRTIESVWLDGVRACGAL